MPQKVPERPHVELKLTRPLVQGSDTIDTVYVLRPKGKEMGLVPLDAKRMADMHPFAAMLSGLTVRELEMLDVEDYMAVQTLVRSFVAEFPQTGPSDASSSADTRTGG